MRALVFSLFLSVATIASAQPVNDHFADRTRLNGLQVNVSGSNVGATFESNELNAFSDGSHPSVWYEWNPPIAGAATISTEGSGFDTRLHLMNLDLFGNLALVDADDDGGVNLTSLLRFTVEAGARYIIKVDGYNGATGSIQLRIDMDTALKLLSAPENRAVATGNSVTLRVDVQGAGNVAHQWSFEGVDLPNETNATLRLTNVQPAAAGTYRVLARNQFGNSLTASATLTVREPFDVGVYANLADVYLQRSTNAFAGLDFLGYRPSLFDDFHRPSAPVVVLPGVFTFRETYLQPLVRAHVEAGGTLVVLGGNRDLLNGAFGWNLATLYVNEASTRQPAVNGTPFASLASELGLVNSVLGLQKASLPTNAVSLFDSGEHSTVAILPQGTGRVVYLGYSWDFARPLFSQDEGWLAVLEAAVEYSKAATPTHRPPRVAVPPLNASVLAGDGAQFDLTVFGSPPLAWQWSFNGQVIAGETNATLTLTNLSLAQAGQYSVTVSNDFGATNVSATLSVAEAGPVHFRIADLGEVAERVVEIGSLVVDDYGGIGLTANQVFAVGDSYTARFDRTLHSGERVTKYDGICSDLRGQTTYVLGRGSTVWSYTGQGFDSLIRLNDAGQTTTDVIRLSQEIPIGHGSLLCSGYGRVVYVNRSNSRIYDILVPSGHVLEYGLNGGLSLRSSESWSARGMAEYFDGSLHVAYVDTSHAIRRLRVDTGEVSLLKQFVDLGDMANFIVDPVTQRWYFSHENDSQFSTGLNEVLGVALAAVDSASLTNHPPYFLTEPFSQSRLPGETVTFAVSFLGAMPNLQWRLNGQPIPGETNTSLVLTNLSLADAGAYSVSATNQFGGVVSRDAVLAVVDTDPQEFRVLSLTADSLDQVAYGGVTGDDYGGIAISATHVFLTGDTRSARFRKQPLGGGTPLPQNVFAFFSDLRARQPYAFGVGHTPARASDRATTIIPLDPQTGEVLTNQSVALSIPLRLNNRSTVFSGFGRVVLHGDDDAVYDILLPSGHVIRRADTVLAPPAPSEGWAAAGIAEYFDGQLHLLFRSQSESRFIRQAVGQSTTEVVQSFANLGDLSNFIVDPYTGRWYFITEGSTQFNTYSETLFAADATATFTLPTNAPPGLISHPTDAGMVVGGDLTLRVRGFGAPPLAYQWLHEGQEVPGATNSSLPLNSISLAAAGEYSVRISNAFGTTNSATAQVAVIAPGPLEFRINQFHAGSAVSIAHSGLTGSTAAGLAVAGQSIFVNGNTRAARIAQRGLRDGVRLSSTREGLCSDLRARTAYVIASASEVGVTSDADRLIRIDPETGDLTDDIVRFSRPIFLSSATLICSGYGRVVFHNGAQNRVYDVLLPSGVVVEREITPLASRGGTGHAWGVAEYFDDALHLTYFADNDRILRQRVGENSSEILQVFSNLGSMKGFIVDPHSSRWFFSFSGASQFTTAHPGLSAGTADLTFAIVSNAPPMVTVLSPDREIISGQSISLAASAFGAPPLHFQWLKEGAPIAGANDPLLLINDAQVSADGLYSLRVSNNFGSVTSESIRLTVHDERDFQFRIVSFQTNDVTVFDHSEITGTTYGGMALIPNHVLISGNTSAGRFRKDDFNNNGRVGYRLEGMFSDLRTQRAYILGAGGSFWLRHNDADSIIPLDPVTGAATGQHIALSQQLDLSYGTKFFSGYGRVVIVPNSGSVVYDVLLPSGQVNVLPGASLADARTSSSGTWGVAEFFAGAIHLVYHGANDNIVRRRVGDSTSQVIGSFFDLGNVANLTIDPHQRRWYFHWTGTSQFGDGSRMLGAAGATVQHGGPADSPPVIARGPSSRTVGVGGNATFSAEVYGSGPLSYQWLRVGVPLPGETNSVLRLEAVTTTDAGVYSLVVTNAIGFTASDPVRLIVRPTELMELRITSLGSNNVVTVDVAAITGDDRGGIAISDQHVFVNGDSAMVRLDKDGLFNPVNLPRVEAMITELGSRQAYILANGANALQGSGAVDTLWPLDPNTGQRSGSPITLSQSIDLGYGSVLFAGYGRVVFWDNGDNVYYDVLMPSGLVSTGALNITDAQLTENWAAWGVAEFFNGELHFAYRQSSSQSIVRRNLDGSVETLAAFASLGDLASFVVDPQSERWYFAHEYATQFTPAGETVASAEAFVITGPLSDVAPLFVTQPTNLTTTVGSLAIFDSRAVGSVPINYQWYRNQTPLPGQTNRGITITNVQLHHQGAYHVTAANGFGATVSETVQLVIDRGIAAVYVNSTNGSPWSQRGNEQSMDLVFGTNHWAAMHFETVDPFALFSPTNNLVFIDGSGTLDELLAAFLNRHRDRMQTWVGNGGLLYLNWAPIKVASLEVGLGGVEIFYQVETGGHFEPNHPLLAGPHQPIGTTIAGFALAHGALRGPDLVPILVGNGGHLLLAEKDFGNGHVMLSGLTTPNFHSPADNGHNLRANTLKYLAGFLNARTAALVYGTHRSGNDMSVELAAPAGLRYVVHSSTNLSTWTMMGTNTAPANGHINLPFRIETNRPAKFFRFRMLP